MKTLSSLTNKEILTKTLEILRRGWTKGASARNVEGHITLPYSPDAVCWCFLGAVKRAVCELPETKDLVLTNSEIPPLFNRASREIGFDHFLQASNFNDGLSSPEPLFAWIEQAIGEAK